MCLVAADREDKVPDPQMNPSSVTLIDHADRPAWEAATRDALPGQSWIYANGLAANGLIPELAVVRSEGAELILPFHQRRFRDAVDIATLPGLSGALIRPDNAAPLREWSDYARMRGWVAGYIQLSALNADLRILLPDQTQTHNAMFVFDLKTWSLDKSVGHNMRKTLRRGDRDATFVVADQLVLMASFPDLYRQSMARFGVSPGFGSECLAVWLSAPGHCLMGGRVGEKIEIVGLCHVSDEFAEGHLIGSTTEGRGLHSWLFWKMAEWLAGQGRSRFNIGGYGVAGDGLYQLKSRLGAHMYPLRAVRQVYDPVRFARLCADTGADPDSDYFPAYRMP